MKTGIDTYIQWKQEHYDQDVIKSYSSYICDIPAGKNTQTNSLNPLSHRIPPSQDPPPPTLQQFFHPPFLGFFDKIKKGGSNYVEAKGGKPFLKRKSVAQLDEIKESLDICNIWRIRTPTIPNFTFKLNHSTRFIDCQLDYIFISSSFQEFVDNRNITCSIN